MEYSFGKTTSNHLRCDELIISRFEKDFDKVECIKQGSFGKVYRCKSRIDKYCYVINEIRLKKDNTEETEEQLRECRSHAQLIHPNIVRYNDAWIEDVPSPIPTYFLYVKLEHYHFTLESFLDQRMSSDDDYHFYRVVPNSLIAAVSFLHDKDIVHCDINPSNIFIKTAIHPDSERVFLGNFGLARQILDTSPSKQSKPGETTFPTCSKWSFQDATLFSAPEQLWNDHNKPVDVYSAGVVIYDLLNYVKTKKERYVMLNEFRNSHLVSERICQRFKALGTLISMMCDKKAKRRPSIEKVETYYNYNTGNTFAAFRWSYPPLQNSNPPFSEMNWGIRNYSYHSTSTSSSILMSSTSLFENNFHKGECIGQGGYGKVYECMSRVDERNYAIKELRLKMNDTEKIEKQLRECRHHAQLIHPNIVRYYDAWVENTSTSFPINILYIKMELCHGTLEKIIDQRMASSIVTSYNFDFKKRVVNSLFSAIGFLHSQRLMHRDIKPSNIFIKNYQNNVNDILLGDFGLVRTVQQLALPKNPWECLDAIDSTNVFYRKSIDDVFLDGFDFDRTVQQLPFAINSSDAADVSVSTNLSSSVGTFCYSAPELSSNNYDQSVDIYSAGIVIYDLFYHVKTKYDRFVILNELRANAAPSSEFYETFPKLASLIKLMMQSPEERPTVFELCDTLQRNHAYNIYHSDLHYKNCNSPVPVIELPNDL